MLRLITLQVDTGLQLFLCFSKTSTNSVRHILIERLDTIFHQSQVAHFYTVMESV